MKIDANSNPQSTVYEASSTGGKALPANQGNQPAVSASTDTVTLSDEATQLASGLSDLAAAVAALPVPEQPQQQSPGHRKPKNSGLSPMLDVDAFRLIRDKLRSRNLGLQEPDDLTKKVKDAKQEETKI